MHCLKPFSARILDWDGEACIWDTSNLPCKNTYVYALAMQAATDFPKLREYMSHTPCCRVLRIRKINGALVLTAPLHFSSLFFPRQEVRQKNIMVLFAYSPLWLSLLSNCIHRQFPTIQTLIYIVSAAAHTNISILRNKRMFHLSGPMFLCLMEYLFEEQLLSP